MVRAQRISYFAAGYIACIFLPFSFDYEKLSIIAIFSISAAIVACAGVFHETMKRKIFTEERKEAIVQNIGVTNIHASGKSTVITGNNNKIMPIADDTG